MNAIEIMQLEKSYGLIKAVDQISLIVPEFSFTAFLGKNGAGKSTTINILATLLEKDAGIIKIFDHVLGEEDEAIRSSIGVVFQQNMLDNRLTVRENLKIRAALYGLHGAAFERRVNEITLMLGMNEFVDQLYGKLSGGQRRKSDLARAFINRPRLLILDEPTTGLDPKSRQEIWAFIDHLRQEKKMTVLLTTHYLEEVETADQVIVIDHGHIIDRGSSSELRQKYTYPRLLITPKHDRLLESLQAAHDVTSSNGQLVIRLATSFEALPIVSQFQNEIEHFEIVQGTMDDVFLSLTKEEQ